MKAFRYPLVKLPSDLQVILYLIKEELKIRKLFHLAKTELACADLLQVRLGYRSTTHSLRKFFDLLENIAEAEQAPIS